MWVLAESSSTLPDPNLAIPKHMACRRRSTKYSMNSTTSTKNIDIMCIYIYIYTHIINLPDARNRSIECMYVNVHICLYVKDTV